MNVFALVMLAWGFIFLMLGMFVGFEYPTKLWLATSGIVAMLLACVSWIFADMWSN